MPIENVGLCLWFRNLGDIVRGIYDKPSLFEFLNKVSCNGPIKRPKCFVDLFRHKRTAFQDRKESVHNPFNAVAVNAEFSTTASEVNALGVPSDAYWQEAQFLSFS